MGEQKEIKKEARKLPPIGDDEVLAKYKIARMPDERIAAKMGITVEEVDKRWKRILERSSRMTESGYGHLLDQFTIFCNQYQLLGESMKIIAMALGNLMPVSEIEPLIVGDSEDVSMTLKNLAKSCIILRPFTPVNPVESLQQATEAIQTSN